MLRYLFCFLFATSLLTAHTYPPHFFKPLKLSTTTLQSLLDLDPALPGFIPVPFRESMGANAPSATEDGFFADSHVLVAEQQFERFCQKPSNSPSFIPRVVHLIWMGSPPPPTVDIIMASWKKYHPDWEIRLWTDKEIACFSWSSPRSEMFFNEAKNWAEKSDILRFEILYEYGGIYSDTDVICLKSFDGLLNGISLFACFDGNWIQKAVGYPLVGSCIIGAAKNHPILKRCLEESKMKKEAPELLQHVRSGPGPITRAAYEALEAGQEDILLLPCSYFFPLPYRKRLASLEEIKECIRPESFAIHLWEASWFD